MNDYTWVMKKSKDGYPNHSKNICLSMLEPDSGCGTAGFPPGHAAQADSMVTYIQRNLSLITLLLQLYGLLSPWCNEFFRVPTKTVPSLAVLQPLTQRSSIKTNSFQQNTTSHNPPVILSAVNRHWEHKHKQKPLWQDKPHSLFFECASYYKSPMKVINVHFKQTTYTVPRGCSA